MRRSIVLRNCLILSRDPLPLAGIPASPEHYDPDYASEDKP